MPEETTNAVATVRSTLHSQLMKLNKDLSDPSCNYDFTLGRISEIAKVLKKLPKDEEEKVDRKDKKQAKEKSKSVFETEADNQR